MATRNFRSDNQAGVHPEVLAAVAAANTAHQPSYGADEHTTRLQDVVASHFGAGAVVFPVFNGTGANVLALQAAVPRWGSVVCAAEAHLNNDESTAPEGVGGLKLVPVPADDGKLTPEAIDRHTWGWGDEHRAQPSAVTITQSTELGTVYEVDEVRAIAEYAHGKGMLLHVDGARIANAAAHLDVGLAELTTRAGVDLLSFGGTKNGLLFGDAVVVLRPDLHELVRSIPFLRLRNLQLASKMRFVSAQLVALLDGDLWLRSARRANAMATLLAERLSDVDGVRILHRVQANAVFAEIDQALVAPLQGAFDFEEWGGGGGVRWMCAFDTTEQDVADFVAELMRLSAAR
ncbi:threonine aldolase family protein [Umezawaea endophytica]|uniref:Aminotransferase class V-fold PLP-dependent enzyme n=1 Tax=Umezawaea endophytica TaxID=1654476 RepID=A0A9X2VEJ0_9PSEU|nr:aminotransferase class V-fold PLP-dependent enzyme [Umezawaea endophytica]MCS7475233.1 aminotransferase class V-fold PLP-dependent enzyme [Umezawaea endophytica]